VLKIVRRELMMAALRWIMVAKLVSVLPTRMATRLNFFSLGPETEQSRVDYSGSGPNPPLCPVTGEVFMADTSDTNLHLTCSNFALLRLIAGLTVIYGNGLILTGGPASAFWGAPLARFGLDFLFALSGYLVAGSWERRPRPLFFLGRRLLRVLPGLAGYSVPWRGLRRRANAGYGSLNKPETTPLAYSYHTRDGTQRSSPQPLAVKKS